MKSSGCLAILQKELLHMLRDPATLLFALLPPVMQVIAFGFAIDTDVRNLATVVCNLDARQASRELLDRFVSTGTFRITERVSSYREISQALVENRAGVGILIPPDYTDRVRAGQSAGIGVFIDGSNNTIALSALAAANGIGFQSAVPQIRGTQASLSPSLPVDIRPRVLFNPDLVSANFFVPGIIGVAIQFSLTMLVAFAIVREREVGTLEQLMVSPATRLGLLLGKLIPYVIFAFLEMALLILVMRFVFAIEIRGSLLLLFVLSGVFSVAVTGIGLLISSSAKNQLQATQMALATLLPSIFLTGFIYPRETMPAIFYAISFFLPLTYFLNILRGIILRGAAFENLLFSAGTLLVMAVVLFSLSVARFRKRLD